MIDSGNTMKRAIDQAKINGAKRVFAFATHGIFLFTRNIFGKCIRNTLK